MEYLVAFQSQCLEKGCWDDFDKTESQIKELEEWILREQEQNNEY